jgi:hypothetical protein
VLAITYSTYVRTHNASDVMVKGNADKGGASLEEIDMDGQKAVAGESSRECEWRCWSAASCRYVLYIRTVHISGLSCTESISYTGFREWAANIGRSGSLE